MSVGLLSGFFWAIEMLLVTVALSYLNIEINAALIPIFVAFLHDVFSAIILIVYDLFKLKRDTLKMAPKIYLGIALGALCGGPIGMSAYLSALNYLGVSITGIIVGINPAMGAFLAFIFLKEKRSLNQILCLLACVLGVMYLGYHNNGLIENLYLGIALAFLTIIAWGFEAVIVGYFLKGFECDNLLALSIRQITSASAYLLLSLCLFPNLVSDLINLSTSAYLIIALAALVGSISYFCYYYAIKEIGASKAMSLNSTYSVFALILGAIFLHEHLSPLNYLIGIVVIILSMVSTYEKKRI